MCGVDLCPGLDDGEDFCGGEVGEGDIVGWGERENVAFSCYRLGAQEDI